MLSTEVFKMATQIFSQRWNTFDSYGEAFLLNNKSLDLNPENENGKEVLKSY